jgi:CheY-like chemotaxis protein
MDKQAGKGSPPPYTRSSRYILVVDGNNSQLFYTAMLLQRFSYPVCTTRTAGAALDMVSVAVPALVITDKILPGLSGIDLLRMLGSTFHTFSVPIILLLPPGENSPHKIDFEGHGAYCLPKPLDIEDLYRTVQELMEPHPRTNIRVSAELSAIVNKVPLDLEKGECVTRLSAHGMYIRTLEPFNPHEQISVAFEIKGRPITADATVLYNRRFDNKPLLEQGMAIKFIRMRGEDRQALSEFIHEEVTRGIIVEHA